MTNREIIALVEKDGLIYTIKYGIVVDEVRDQEMKDAVEEAKDAIRRIENVMDRQRKQRVGFKGD